jgi:hypothetical protein
MGRATRHALTIEISFLEQTSMVALQKTSASSFSRQNNNKNNQWFYMDFYSY